WVYWVYGAMALAALLGLAALAPQAYLARGGSAISPTSAHRPGPRLLLTAARGVSIRIPALALALTWALTVLFLVARWTLTTLGPQGRLAFPALPVFALVLTLGLGAFVPRRWTGAVFGGLLVGLWALAAVLPARVIQPAYAGPPVYGGAAEVRPGNASGVKFGPAIRLLGYDVDDRDLRPGGELRLILFWE